MNAESRQPVFSGNISVTENILDITQININSTSFVISQFSISGDISETRTQQYCKLRWQHNGNGILCVILHPIPGTNIDRVVGEISNCDITAV